MRIHSKKLVKAGLDILLAVGAIVFLLWYFAPPREFFEKQFSFDLNAVSPESIFRIFSGGERFPKFTTAIIEPQDVQPGDIQKLSVGLEDPDGVASVVAETELDRGTSRLELQLVEGDDKSGYWTNAWIVRDTHSKTYRTKFTARDRLGRTNAIVLAWSDSCTSPSSGDWTIAATCSISGADGADNGNIDIGGIFDITVLAGATLVYNTAKQITIGTGRLIVNDTGQIKEANLFVTDNDNDGYANSAFTRTYSTAASLTNYVRRYTLATNPYDCDDASATAWVNRYTDADSDTYCPNSTQTCVGSQAGYRDSCTTFTDCDDTAGTKYQTLTCYLDSDGDNYTVGTGTSVCKGTSCASPADSYKALTAVDCLDSAANVYPTNANWYITSGTNGWDYNCSSATEYYPYNNRGSDNLCGNGVQAYDTTKGCNSTAATAGWQSALSSSLCGTAQTYYTGTCASTGLIECSCSKEDCSNPSYLPSAGSQTTQCH